MRILFLTLLVLNLGFLGYHLVFVDSESVAETEVLPGQEVATLEPLPLPPLPRQAEGPATDKDEAGPEDSARAADAPDLAAAEARDGGGTESAATAAAEQAAASDPEPEPEPPVVAAPDAGREPGEGGAASEMAAPQPVCYALGPLTSQSRDRVEERVASTPLTIVERWEGERSEPRYWVHLPPAPDMESARERQQTLEAAGYRDNLIVRNGELARSISLGLFADRTNASDLRKRLQNDGFDVRIREQARRITAPFLGLRVPGESDDAQAGIRGLIESGEARLTERPCDRLRGE